MDGHPQPTESFSDLLYLQSISLLTLELRVWTQAQGGPPWPEWLLLVEAELEPRPVNRSSSRMLVPSSAEHRLCHCSERTSSKLLQDFPGGPVVKTLQGVKVRFLVGELTCPAVEQKKKIVTNKKAKLREVSWVLKLPFEVPNLVKHPITGLLECWPGWSLHYSLVNMS